MRAICTLGCLGSSPLKGTTFANNAGTGYHKDAEDPRNTSFDRIYTIGDHRSAPGYRMGFYKQSQDLDSEASNVV